jgi:hypothetical protein
VIEGATSDLIPPDAAVLDRLAAYSTAGVSIGDVATAFPGDWTAGSATDPLLVVAWPPGSPDYDTAAYFGSSVPTSTGYGVLGATGVGTAVYGTATGAAGTGVLGHSSAANAFGVQADATGAGGIALDARAASSAIVALRARGLLQVQEQAAPPNPPAGYQYLYIDSTSHHLCRKDENGTVVDLG